MSIPAHFGETTTGAEVAEFYKDEIKGKNVLITGASPNGLGSEFAKVISKHHPGLLILAGRTLSNLEQTKADILKDEPNVAIRILVVDIASLDSVRKAAAEVLSLKEHVDVNVQNAGIMFAPEGTTVDGFEQTFATNHLGPFLLTNLILQGSSAPKPRNVIISSNGQRLFEGGVNFDQPGYVIGKKDVFDRWTAYGASKSANVLFASALRRKKELEAVSLHPGAILTELVRYMTFEDQMAAGFVDEEGTLSDKYTFKNIAQGVATHVVAAFAPSPVLFPTPTTPAPYLEDCQVRMDLVADWSKGQDKEDRLWQLSEDLVGQQF